MPATYNILFLFPLPFIPERGGVERVTDLLARELAARGHRIFYMHRPDKQGRGVTYDAPASIHYLPKRRLKSRRNIRFYHRFLRENNIHFIINQMGLSNNYCPFTRVPVNETEFPRSISVLHNPPLMEYEHMGISAEEPATGSLGSVSSSFRRHILLPLRRWRLKRKRVAELRDVARSSNCMCVLSQAFSRQLSELGILSGTDCHLCSITNPCAFAPVAALPEKKQQILYVGRLDPGQKAPQRLIPIWQRLCHRFPDWELIIIGEGSARSYMEQEAAKLPRMRLVGYQSPSPWFLHAALSCLTSTYEGFGLVLLEAMCHGTVPIAFNSFPVLGELLEGHMDRLAATPFDADDFANKLAWLMEHEDERNRLAEACIAKSAEYTLASVADKWETLFSELAQRR